MRGVHMPTYRLMVGIGIVGDLLQTQQPVPTLRRALLAHGFSSNEVSLVFDAVRNGKIDGVRVDVLEGDGIHYWRLASPTYTA